MKFNFYCIVFINLLFMSGCAQSSNSINPSNNIITRISINDNVTSLSSEEKQKIFDVVFADESQVNPMKYSFKDLWRGRISFQEKIPNSPSSYSLGTSIGNDFSLKDNTIEVKNESYYPRKSNIESSIAYKTQFDAYTKELSVRIAKRYEKLLEEYPKFDDTLRKFNDNLDAKKNNLKVNIIDSKGLLSSKVLNELNKINIIETYDRNNKFLMFLLFASKDFDNIVWLRIEPARKLKEFTIDYEMNSKWLTLSDMSSNNPIFKISSVALNYVPNKFSVKNEDIELEFAYPDFENVSSFSGEKIKIYNKSKEAIVITNISGYCGKDGSQISTDILKEAIKTLPLSETKISSSKLKHLSCKDHIQVMNIKDEMLYGYFIEYSINGVKKSIPIEKSVKKYKMSDFI